ncbi:MAG: precorrin-6y C5,15-methyltransferase (decarboxylating) subunit CbiE [Eubacteriales bacterium]|jgi:precorrin-6Y C5,15-methyltransferase (decarboxylating)
MEIAVIGIGMGYEQGLTVEAADFIRKADLIAGSGRLTEFASALRGTGCTYVSSWKAEEIRQAVDEHPEAEKVAVLYSGDTGFFSGASGIVDALPKNARVRFMPGISSVSFFCSRLRRSWQDVHFVSMHGRDTEIVGQILHYPHVMAILGSDHDVADISRKLTDFDLNGCVLTVGENLGSLDEKIFSGHPSDFLNYSGCSMSVILIDSCLQESPARSSVPDAEFIRGDVPMTKEEVRTVSLSKLRVRRNSVVYDVGAGTGSVTVEAALAAWEGKVFAVEKNPSAVALLRQNIRKLRAASAVVVEGTAPEALESLPAPDCVFVGGSSGNLAAILKTVRAKNPAVRVVVNAITPETLSSAIDSMNQLGFSDPEIVCVSVSKGRKAGHVHLMTAQNPVYILSSDAIPENGDDGQKNEAAGQEG